MDETMIMLIIWLAIFIIALIAEIFSEALISLWFCIGAIIALAVTFIPGMTWWGELIIFLAVSAVSFFIIRPIVTKNMKRLQSKTNVDELIGKKGVIIKEVTSLDSGEVKLNGVVWTAIKRDSDCDLNVGEVVEVVSIVGNKLLVKKA